MELVNEERKEDRLFPHEVEQPSIPQIHITLLPPECSFITEPHSTNDDPLSLNVKPISISNSFPSQGSTDSLHSIHQTQHSEGKRNFSRSKPFSLLIKSRSHFYGGRHNRHNRDSWKSSSNRKDCFSKTWGHAELNSLLTPSPENYCLLGSLKSNERRKLILHFDARNTIFVADLYSRITTEQAFNTFLSGLVWGQVDESGNWKRSTKQLSLLPPNENCISVYKFMEKQMVHTASDRARLRQLLGNFTHTEQGQDYAPYMEEYLKYLEWPNNRHDDGHLTVRGGDGRTSYHYLLPSFFQLIQYLQHSGRDYAIVIRTYGRDAPHILSAIQRFSYRLHPDFADASRIKIEHAPHIFKRDDSNECRYTYYSSAGERVVLTNEREIFHLWNNVNGVIGVVDDFDYWLRHDYHFQAAKPLWFDLKLLQNGGAQHILFDDNIRLFDEDSILNLKSFHSRDPLPREGHKVSSSSNIATDHVDEERSSHRPKLRCISESGYGSLDSEFSTVSSDGNEETIHYSQNISKEEMKHYENILFVQADLLDSVKNKDYFIRKVSICEERLKELLKIETFCRSASVPSN